MEPMIKKALAALLFLCLLLGGAQAEGAESPAPVTDEELTALLTRVLAQVEGSQPLNDPTDEAARSEDGVCLQYETAKIYAEGAALTKDTPVNTLVFDDSEGAVFRTAGVDTQWLDLLSAFPLENRDLAGTREGAVLYLTATENGGFFYGVLVRDGQRPTVAEYGEVFPQGDDYRQVSVTFRLLNGLVTGLRVDGLNPDRTLDASQARELEAELAALQKEDGYRAVKTSRNGLELTPFSEEDLTFSGFSYGALRPDTLPGAPETERIDNGDGAWLLRCDGEGYEAVFLSDGDDENARILSFSLLDPALEGPRCVRLGDLFSEDFARFRSGEGEMTEEMTEVLYGEEGTPPWGMASYDAGGGGMSLRQLTDTADGPVAL